MPTPLITMPDPNEDPRRFLTHAELDHLLERTLALFPEHYALVYTAAFTGMRIGELIALRRVNYNPLARRIDVREAAKRRKGVRQATGLPKSGKTRPVPLDEQLVAVINAHLAGHESDYVFPAAEGGRIQRNNFRGRSWLKIRDAADLPELRFHDLRHTFISHMLMVGYEPIEVATIVGHTSTRMQNLYGHFIPGKIEEPLARLRAGRRNSSSAGAVCPVATPSQPARAASIAHPGRPRPQPAGTVASGLP